MNKTSYKDDAPSELGSKYYARDPPRLRSGQALAPLEKTRAFGTTPEQRALLDCPDEAAGLGVHR
jgi:hypothetical protein